jgi:nicotinamidase/pyrazinamidase
MPKIAINKQTTTSLDVDAQNTFTSLCPDELPVPGGMDIVSELNAQAQFACYRMGSKDAHSPQAPWVASIDKPMLTPIQGHPNIDVHWPAHAIPGSKGFELIAGLPKVTDYDYFVWKGIEPDMHPYGACYHDFAEQLSTGMIEFLHQKEITTVIVGGLAMDICVKVTVLQLLKAGFKVILNLAAARGVDVQNTKDAIHEMQRQGCVTIHSAADLYLET